MLENYCFPEINELDNVKMGFIVNKMENHLITRNVVWLDIATIWTLTAKMACRQHLNKKKKGK